MRCLPIQPFHPSGLLKRLKKGLLPLLLFPCIFVPTSYAKPIPDRFGLTVNCIDKVYEDISEVMGLEDSWSLHIVPDTIHKACIKDKGIYISYKFVQTLHCVDELACVVGHEIAHIKLGHIICCKNGNDDRTEAEADYWGYRYARLAGYNPDVCELLSRNHFPENRINYLKVLLVQR